MRCNVEASTEVRAPIQTIRELLLDDPGCAVTDRVLAPGERENRSIRSSLCIEMGRGAIQHDVLIDLRPTTSEAGVVRLPLSWRASGYRRLLPSFEGELAATGDPLHTTLTLRGSYTVPLGPIGRLGERVAGRRLAHQSLTAFLERAAHRLDGEAARRMDEVTWHPAPYPVSVRDIGP